MIILGIEIMHVWEAQSWEQSNVIWVLKLWRWHIGVRKISCQWGCGFFVLFNHKKKHFSFSEIRMNFGRGNGAAWGRFGLMRDIQWSWRATLPRTFFSPRISRHPDIPRPWCLFILKITLFWKTKLLVLLQHPSPQLQLWTWELKTNRKIRSPRVCSGTWEF